MTTEMRLTRRTRSEDSAGVRNAGLAESARSQADAPEERRLVQAVEDNANLSGDEVVWGSMCFSFGVKIGADESGEDITVEGGGAAGTKQVPGDCGHRGVVGAELQRSDAQFDPFLTGHDGELFAERLICGHAAANGQSLSVLLTHGQAAFFHEHFDGGRLERRSEVSDAIGRSFRELPGTGDSAGRIQECGFES